MMSTNEPTNRMITVSFAAHVHQGITRCISSTDAGEFKVQVDYSFQLLQDIKPRQFA